MRASDDGFTAYARNGRTWSLIQLVGIFMAALIVRNVLFHDYRHEAIESLISSGKSKDEVFAKYILPTFLEWQEESKAKQTELEHLSAEVESLRAGVKELKEMMINGTRPKVLEQNPENEALG